jgi:hypothetical protein
MGKVILKMSGEGGDFYLMRSTNADASITYGLSMDEFKEYCWEKYGNRGMQDLPGILNKADEIGCSKPGMTIYEVIMGNRAGEDEKEISKEEIYSKYCLNRPK